MPDTQFSPLGTVSAPADWRLPPSLELVLKAAQATFDGTGAGGSFQPALQIVSDSGHSVGIYPCDTTIAAGSSAEVSFFPFSPSSAGGGSDLLDVLYNTSPQTGNFLVSTTATGTTINNSGAGQINLNSDDGAGGGGFVGISTADGEVFTGSTVIVERLNPTGGTFEVQNHNGSVKMIQVQESGYVFFNLADGVFFSIFDHLGAEILRVAEGGGVPSYHLQAGGAWVADL